MQIEVCDFRLLIFGEVLLQGLSTENFASTMVNAAEILRKALADAPDEQVCVAFLGPRAGVLTEAARNRINGSLRFEDLNPKVRKLWQAIQAVELRPRVGRSNRVEDKEGLYLFALPPR
ncbi:MAG TPA: hypothetical protein VFT87_02765 [Candidatus Saccharimonadales bacterium]|nr:hypothetical protein [Candidatus Saccharimonadales bacterium]